MTVGLDSSDSHRYSTEVYGVLSVCIAAGIWLYVLAMGYRRLNIPLLFLSLQFLFSYYQSCSLLTSKHKGLGFLGSPLGGGISDMGYVDKDL